MIVPTAADLSGAQRSELSTQLRDEPSSSNHWWWQPGEFTPQRPPDLERVVKQ